MGQGMLSWDLPVSMVVVEGETVLVSIRVENPSTEEQNYGIGYLFIDTEGTILSGSWGLIEFTADILKYNMVTLQPGTYLQFNVPFTAPEPGLYFLTLRLHYPREGSFHVGEFYDEVSVFFGELTPGTGITSVIEPLITIAMIVMMVAMVKSVIKPST